MHKVIFLSVLLCFCWKAGEAQDCHDLKGAWVNEHGSVLQIDTIIDQQIHGEYRSSTGVDGQTFSLIGLVNKDLENPDQLVLSFSVHWGDYGSITSWTGYCLQEGNQCKIKTLWHLARPRVEYDWEHIIANSSTFVPFD